jgi:hypothetical protein
MVIAEYTVGDTAPDLVLELMEDGGQKDLTGVLAVVLMMRKPSLAAVERAMTIDVTPTTGLASYTPTVDDFDEAGEYDCELRVTNADGGLQHGVSAFQIAVRDPYEEV